jgi:hypothetical protein
MEEVLAAEGVMSQSLFDPPTAVAQAGGVLEQMMEGQDQLRGELGLVAEKLERLESGQVKAREALVKLEGREPSRAPVYLAIGVAVAALLLAGGAFLLSF